MKKAYVKVKPKKTKKAAGIAYIVATVAGAAVCAVVFSFVLRPDTDIIEDMEIDLSEVTAEEIAQVSEPMVIEVEKEPEPEKIEPEPTKPPEETEPTAKNETTQVQLIMPVSGEIINEYSASKPVKSKTMGDWRVHSGIDIKAPSGTVVAAPAKGKVIASGEDKLTGKTVSIDHGNGIVSTLYNLSQINVEAGEQVEKGETVGTVGTSAPTESADDPHVHFEVKKDGKYVNPKEYIK